MNFSFKKNIIIIVIAGVLALGVGGTVIGVSVYNSPANQVSRYLNTAERYLSEMNYEQAVIEFQKILEIEPMNVDAYLGLADAYIGMGNTEKALEILREGLEKTGDSRIQKKIDELAKPEEPEVSSSESSSSSSSSSESSTESEPVESLPEYGSMGSVTISGREYDIATTTSIILSSSVLDEVEITNEDVKQISKLINLTELTINDYLLQAQLDITPLAELTNLTNLELLGINLSDLTPLSGLTNLKCLSLSYNPLGDLSPLAGLTNLTELDLGFNKISDLTPLAGLPNLTNLNLTATQISDISSLTGFTNLTELDLSYNKISDFTPLAKLTNLTDLTFSKDLISDADIAWLQEKLPNCSIGLW